MTPATKLSVGSGHIANLPMPLLDSPGVGQTGWQKAILCLQTSYDLEEAANEVDLRNIKELEAA